MLRKDVTYKVTIEQRPKGCEGASQVDIWRTHILGRSNDNCKGWVAKLSKMSKKESSR